MSASSWLQQNRRVPETIHALLREGAEHDMSADYSVTAGSFRHTAAAGERIYVERLLFYYEMGGVWTMAKFGSLAALTNGIIVRVVRANGTSQLLTNGLPVKNNGQFAAHCYDWAYLNVGSGSNAAAVRWTLARSGAPVTLYEGDYIEVVPNDDLSTMTLFTCKMDGVLIGPTRDS